MNLGEEVKFRSASFIGQKFALQGLRDFPFCSKATYEVVDSIVMVKKKKKKKKKKMVLVSLVH